MKQQTTVLVTSQDESSRVYEARRRRIKYTMNPVTLLTTESDKFNGWINGILKLIEDQKTRMEKNNEESKTTLSITSLENDRVEITVFLLIHNFTRSTNGNASAPAAIVPAPAAVGCCYEDRGSAHAWKITASLNNQSESLCENWSTPTKLEDLRWTDRPIDESYRRQFLESFARYNEILRAHGNYYAARTSRYTTIQSRLTPCIAVPYDKRKRQVVEDPRRSFDSKRLKESQTYRIILTDKKSSDNVTVTEVESLRKENELLGRALRKAADLHLSMLTETEATLKEKESLAAERQALENERRVLDESRASALKENERLTEERRDIETAKQELRSQKKELKRSTAKTSGKLREKERQLEETRRGLDLERRQFTARQEVFEKFYDVNSGSLREEAVYLKDQRQTLEQDMQKLAVSEEELKNRYEAIASGLAGRERSLKKQQRNLERERGDLSTQKTELQRSSEASASKLSVRERSLERQRQALAQDRQELVERKEMFERSNEAQASNLRNQERLSAQQRERLERDQRELAEQREMLRQQETASAASRRQQEASLEERRRVLEQFEEELVARRREFEEYYETRIGNLRVMEESVEADRRALERGRQRLSTREDELRTQRNAARTTPPTEADDVSFSLRSVNDGWKGRVKLPLTTVSVPWRIKLPWY